MTSDNDVANGAETKSRELWLEAEAKHPTNGKFYNSFKTDLPALIEFYVLLAKNSAYS